MPAALQWRCCTREFYYSVNYKTHKPLFVYRRVEMLAWQLGEVWLTNHTMVEHEKHSYCQSIVTVDSVATMRVISERHLAAMVVKGICQFPENGDRMGGTIDIWWIVRILLSKIMSHFAIIGNLVYMYVFLYMKYRILNLSATTHVDINCSFSETLLRLFHDHALDFAALNIQVLRNFVDRYIK